MSRDIVPLGLRMPPDLKDQIEQAAKASGRSMNAEIVARLQASFNSQPSGLDVAVLRDVIKTFARMMQLAANPRPGTAADAKTAQALQAIGNELVRRLTDKEET